MSSTPLAWHDEYDEWVERLRHIKTRFVRDRIRETSFEDRDRMIDTLLGYEGLATKRGYPTSMIRGMCEKEFPVETACIRREISKGIYTPTEEYVRLLKAYERQKSRIVKREARQARHSRRQAFDLWEQLRKSEP